MGFLNGQKWSRVFWTDKDNKEYTGWSKVDSSFIKPEKFRSQFPWRLHKDMPVTAPLRTEVLKAVNNAPHTPEEDFVEFQEEHFMNKQEIPIENFESTQKNEEKTEKQKMWIRVVLEDENGQQYVAKVRADKQVEFDHETDNFENDQEFESEPNFYKNNEEYFHDAPKFGKKYQKNHQKDFHRREQRVQFDDAYDNYRYMSHHEDQQIPRGNFRAQPRNTRFSENHQENRFSRENFENRRPTEKFQFQNPSLKFEKRPSDEQFRYRSAYPADRDFENEARYMNAQPYETYENRHSFTREENKNFKNEKPSREARFDTKDSSFINHGRKFRTNPEMMKNKNFAPEDGRHQRNHFESAPKFEHSDFNFDMNRNRRHFDDSRNNRYQFQEFRTRNFENEDHRPKDNHHRETTRDNSKTLNKESFQT